MYSKKIQSSASSCNHVQRLPGMQIFTEQDIATKKHDIYNQNFTVSGITNIYSYLCFHLNCCFYLNLTLKNEIS